MLYVGNLKKKIMYLKSMAQRCLIFARGIKDNYFLDVKFQQLIEIKLIAAL